MYCDIVCVYEILTKYDRSQVNNFHRVFSFSVVYSDFHEG